MENISEFLFGKDYSDKLNKFNKAIDQIHAEYDGEFDKSGYFTMQTHNQKGEVKYQSFGSGQSQLQANMRNTEGWVNGKLISQTGKD